MKSTAAKKITLKSAKKAEVVDVDSDEDDKEEENENDDDDKKDDDGTAKIQAPVINFYAAPEQLSQMEETIDIEAEDVDVDELNKD